MILKRSNTKDRPYIFPATLVQRFGGFLLDIGLIVIAAIALKLTYHFVFNVPIGGIRYIPPSPDDGWHRTIRSVFINTGLIAFMAGFLCSKYRASPGMESFFISCETTNGQKPSFIRSFLWTLTGLTPLLIANYLVLVGIALEKPIMHFGLLNLFNLMIIAQSLFFIPVLIRPDKASIPDLICGMRVKYRSRRPEGMHPLRKIAHIPFLVIFLFIMAGSSALSALNLLDAPIDPKIKIYEELRPLKINPVRETWRNDASFEISVKLIDFRCSSTVERFSDNPLCPDHTKVSMLVEEHQELIKSYNRSIKALRDNKTRLHDIYLNQESLALTDLALAQIIINYEKNPKDEHFEHFLNMQSFWRDAAIKPGHLMGQSRALIHYSRILLALPVFIEKKPEILSIYEAEIDAMLSPIAFDDVFMDGIMAHEYGIYDHMLGRSQIDYFPFIQPNHTRNEFVYAARALQRFFDLDTMVNQKHKHAEITKDLRDEYKWNVLYNPVGTFFRDFALQNVQNSPFVVTAYHSNNALKDVLRIFIQAKKQGVTMEKMGEFLKTLPQEQQSVLGRNPVIWDDQSKSLYYTMPGLQGFRREVQL